MTNEDDYNTKTVSRYLVYDWRDDKLRTRKSKPSKNDLSPYEQPVSFSFEVRIPEVEIPEVSAVFEVPESDLREVVVDQLQLQSPSEDSLFGEPKDLMMLYNAEDIKEKWEEIEDRAEDIDDLEVSFARQAVDYLRKCHSYELSNANREDVLSFLEDTISYHKGALNG